MPLVTGTRLGPYEILAPLGVGGMGEVYRARDTRLDRSVAIKVLPSHLISDPERRARFEREAKAVSSLNHPHICTLYDVGHEQGTDYLVMELVEGKTLAQRLKKGGLPLEQTLRTAIEIADALDKAHRQGLIHRDLKPANVMLTKVGSKLMDFGLAKRAPGAEDGGDIWSLATEPAPLTGHGMLVGTIPYMAPERLEGKEADARSDLWAFGCVLYEMATGRRAFEGTSQASLISAIMDGDPQPITQLQPLTPPALERLVRVCLSKDPDDRLQTAHDVMQELKWIAEALAGAGAAGGASGDAAAKRRSLAVGTLGPLIAVSCVILGVVLERRWLAPMPSRPPVLHALLDIGPAEELTSGGLSPTSVYTRGGSHTALTWAPDGRSVVFVGRRGGVQQLYIRPLDSDEARSLDGSEGAEIPAVSPDGRWVAFWSKGAIRRLPIAGGPSGVVVGRSRRPSGMAWGPDGRLFYGAASCAAEQNVICAVTPEHAPTALTKRASQEASAEQHVLPHVLPDGRALLYTVRRRTATWGDEELFAHVLATGERKLLLKDATDARYVTSGHLVFLRRGTLLAVGFDLPRLEVLGTPVPVLDAVAQALTSGSYDDITGAGQFSVAPNGSIAYIRSAVVPFPDMNIVAIDRQGQVRPLSARPQAFGPMLSLSPDGHQLAVVRRDFTEMGLWTLELSRGTLTRLHVEGENSFPRWTPDGQRVAYSWLNKGIAQLVWQRADGTGAPEVLGVGPDMGTLSWSPDGRQLALVRSGDIQIASFTSEGMTVKPFIETPEEEAWPEFSPDGRWLAYGSNVSGRNEVYVQPYPGPGPRRQVSLEGGGSPAWSPTGRELFFTSPRDARGQAQMMAVDVRPGPTLDVGRPRPLFSFSQPPLVLVCVYVTCYSVAADGQRFYATQQVPGPPLPPVTQIHLVLNWSEELKARVAAAQAK